MTEAEPPDKDVSAGVRALFERSKAHVPDALADHAEANDDLDSLVASERRSALANIARRGPTDDEVRRVERLVFDPEREIRALALATLGQRPDLLDPDVCRRALSDPSDEVRAAAVRLLAATGAAKFDDVVGVAFARRWPAARRAASEVLSSLLASRDTPLDTDLLLAAAAGTDSPADAEERVLLEELAGAVGLKALLLNLERPGPPRLGAAHLLLAEGSTPALSHVARLIQDPDRDIRACAEEAAERLAARRAAAGASEGTDAWGGAAAAEDLAPPPTEAIEAQMLSSLAAALEDPDEAVRARAQEVLSLMSQSRLEAWAERALTSGEDRPAMLAARAVEAAGMQSATGPLLARAAATNAQERGPFISALGAIDIEPTAVAQVVSAVEPRLRPEAVRVLVQARGRRALEGLRPLSGHPSAAVRMAVLEAFADAFDPEAVEVAGILLETDSSPVVRALAIRVIGRAGDDRRLGSLAHALADPDPDVRATALDVLAPGAGPRSSSLLAAALKDEDERVWLAAARHLATLADAEPRALWEAIATSASDRRAQLLDALEQAGHERLASLALDRLGADDPADRILAVGIAARAATPECAAAIAASLRDTHPGVRAAAAVALASRRDPQAIPYLSGALMDPDAGVRAEAVRALASIDDDSVVNTLVTALKDPERGVRELAGDALLGWRSAIVPRLLVDAVSVPALRREASRVLSAIGPRAVGPLMEALERADAGIRPLLGEILETIATPEEFIAGLGAMDPAERKRSVDALGAMGGETALEGLRRALLDPDEAIRIRALELLGNLGDPRATDAVRQAFLDDPVPEVVRAAEAALRRLQGEGPADAPGSPDAP